MNSWKRLTAYILLNVIVSAVTILAVLVIWDRMRGPASGGLLSGLVSAPAAPAGASAKPTIAPAGPKPTPTRTFTAYQVQSGDDFDSIAKKFGVNPEELIAVNGFQKRQPIGAGEVLRIPVAPKAEITIQSIAGAGDLETERVNLTRPTDGELDLSGWELITSSGETYTFPAGLVLLKDVSLTVYTRPGANTVRELYWNLQKPVWKSGDTATLKDSAGATRQVFTIP
jgi:LysM repeat protein